MSVLRTIVAQICNLLYRRFAIGAALILSKGANRKFRKPQFENLRYALFGCAVFLFLFVAFPQPVSAHGVLLIRINEVTQKIEATTNHLVSLYLERGELYREDLNWTNAEMDYARAAELGANLVEVDFCRAKMLDDSGQLEASRAMFDKVLARSPENGEAFIGRARVRLKLKQPEPAIADFRHGLTFSKNPKPEYFLELSRVLISENKTNDALAVLDQGIKRFGPLAPLQLCAVELDFGQKNYESALARLDTVLKRAARKENWLARRGEILLAAGRTSEARKAFEDSLAAIRLLPAVLQNASPMQNLQERVQSEMAKTVSENNRFAETK